MTTMIPPEADRLWTAIDDQRRRTADLLESLPEEQWDHPSLCDGWTVRHVAAHLTLQRQGPGDAAGLIARHPRLLRSLTLNRMIHDSALLEAEQLTTDEIIGRIREGVGSRRHNVFVTAYDTLSDILVHSQDIARPLGVGLPMDPEAAAVGATRRWDTRRSWMSLVFGRLPLADHTLVATDADWSRGHGSEVTGPIGSLLLLITGRTVALDDLSGPGVQDLRRAVTHS